MSSAIVIGAGVAGLSAARELVRVGWEVELFEARPFVGGRVRTLRPRPGWPPLELGADFLHGRHPALMRLIRRAKGSVRNAEGRHFEVSAGQAAASASTDGRFERAMALLLEMERAGEPSVEAFLSARRRDDAEAVEVARRFVEGFYAADARRAAPGPIGRMQRMADSVGAEKAYRIWQGYDLVPQQLLRELEGKARLRLGFPVREVRWRPGSVEVVAESAGAKVRAEARAAVIALPLTMLRLASATEYPEEAPRFRPTLKEKTASLSKLWMGPVVKVLLAFNKPVWSEGRAGKLEGLGMLQLSSGDLPVWWRPLPHAEPVLVGWAGGPHARALGRLGPERQRGAALEALARGFGLSRRYLEEALDFSRVVDWAQEPFVRGGYAVVGPGGDGAMAELSRPLSDTLFFAGEATEPDWAGTVHGALVSGERAARQLTRAAA